MTDNILKKLEERFDEFLYSSSKESFKKTINILESYGMEEEEILIAISHIYAALIDELC